MIKDIGVNFMKYYNVICIFGVKIYSNDLPEKLISMLYELHSRQKNPIINSLREYKEIQFYFSDFMDLISDEELFFESISSDKSDSYNIFYIGLGIDKMKDTETLKEFKSRIKLSLIKIGINKDPELIFESWNEGDC